MELGLNGRGVLITGASKGIGRACAEGFAAEGCTLDLVSRSAADLDALAARLRDKHGVTLAPGQAHLKGKIFRIGHIGWFDVFDIASALAAVELSLTELGAEIERGVAVARAFEAFETPVTA